MKLLQFKRTHSEISNTSLDLETHVKYDVFLHNDKPNYGIHDANRVAKLPQTNTMLITLYYHIQNVYISSQKCPAYSDCFINENWPTFILP